jgi:Domain of unknown function (DUF4124)
MSGRLPLIVAGVLCALAGLVPVAASADGAKDKAVYRWTDDQGVVHYGDQIPPQYAQKERSVLNSRGIEVGRLDAQKTPQQAAAEARAQQEQMRQRQHDAFLMSNYTSVQDIEAVRDVRLDQLHGQKVAAEQYVDSLHSRLRALQARAKIFKPYSARPDARRMPDDLAEDLVHALSELRTQGNVVATKSEEETALKAQFQADIDRYRELHAASARN